MKVGRKGIMMNKNAITEDTLKFLIARLIDNAKDALAEIYSAYKVSKNMLSDITTNVNHNVLETTSNNKGSKEFLISNDIDEIEKNKKDLERKCFNNCK